jgi:anti-sigma factor ChrR (cupin superfamily)
MLDAALRHIASTADDQYRPYNRYGTPVPGMSWIPLSGELNNDTFECFMLRMDPGACSKPHEHTSGEEFLILDGELIDCDGQRFHAGDYVCFEPGSKHSSHTPTGCKLLVILRGRNRALGPEELD